MLILNLIVLILGSSKILSCSLFSDLEVLAFFKETMKNRKLGSVWTKISSLDIDQMMLLYSLRCPQNCRVISWQDHNCCFCAWFATVWKGVNKSGQRISSSYSPQTFLLKINEKIPLQGLEAHAVCLQAKELPWVPRGSWCKKFRPLHWPGESCGLKFFPDLAILFSRC